MMVARVLLSVGVLASLAACGGAEGDKPRQRPPLLVSTELAATSAFAPQLEALGTVTPLQTVQVRARAEGQILRIAFREGDTVRAGQLLFQLDDREARAALAQAEAGLAAARATAAQAEADFGRAQALVTKGFIAGTVLDARNAAARNAVAAIADAQAQVATARARLSYLAIHAPVSGRTGELNFRLGANVRVGDALPLVTINQIAPIHVRFPVPPDQIQAVRLAMRAGADVTVSAREAADTPIATGRLAFLDNNVDPGNGSIAAKAEFANADDLLWPGAIVTVRMPLAGPRSSITLPEGAVQLGRDAPFVWMVGADGKVRMRDVDVAGRMGGKVYLAGGVSPGERIVTDTLSRLKPGDAVRFKGNPNGGGRRPQSAADDRASAGTGG